MTNKTPPFCSTLYNHLKSFCAATRSRMAAQNRPIKGSTHVSDSTTEQLHQRIQSLENRVRIIELKAIAAKASKRYFPILFLVRFIPWAVDYLKDLF